MGLLAIIICCQDKISDVYRELLPLLSEALESGTATLKVNTKEHSAEVLLQYILGCFFLQAWRDGDSATTLGMGKIAVYYFSNRLEHNDKLVRVAACEALALIFETGSLDKFWKEAKDHSNCSHMQQSLRPTPQEAGLPEGCESLDSLPTPE
ncbi:interferon-related developmental regulator family protein / IFRD protein family [Prunus dulcis]|uniref:Interferon-related developmental regulator family protein / IFRD protein family n=1 Tax=Prunus dulcis TaxID=3755 RepID=A0A4Y1RZQ8_PRUDU|nr:interferon-related developmental regulator family protein / IFRD protein family [Prunus dulcis]